MTTQNEQVIRVNSHPVITHKIVYEVYHHDTHIVTFHKTSPNCTPFDGIKLDPQTRISDYLKSIDGRTWWG